jgi:hypothetical protein
VPAAHWASIRDMLARPAAGRSPKGTRGALPMRAARKCCGGCGQSESEPQKAAPVKRSGSVSRRKTVNYVGDAPAGCPRANPRAPRNYDVTAPQLLWRHSCSVPGKIGYIQPKNCHTSSQLLVCGGDTTSSKQGAPQGRVSLGQKSLERFPCNYALLEIDRLAPGHVSSEQVVSFYSAG